MREALTPCSAAPFLSQDIKTDFLGVGGGGVGGGGVGASAPHRGGEVFWRTAKGMTGRKKCNT